MSLRSLVRKRSFWHTKILLIISSAFASKILDDIRSLERSGSEVTMTLKSHAGVYRFPATNTFPCLENAHKAKKSGDIVMNEDNRKVLECKLAPRMHAEAAGR